ncbi:MAG: hypothetical protein ACRD4L_04750 [Pyrinomonadaceae bacterium]
MARNLNDRNPYLPPVRHAMVKEIMTVEEMSPLGRDLVRISAEIEASGEELLSHEKIEREVALRRGGYDGE